MDRSARRSSPEAQQLRESHRRALQEKETARKSTLAREYWSSLETKLTDLIGVFAKMPTFGGRIWDSYPTLHWDSRRFEYSKELSPGSFTRMCREECQRLRDLLCSLQERAKQDHIFGTEGMAITIAVWEAILYAKFWLVHGIKRDLFRRHQEELQRLLREHEEHLRLCHWQEERYTSDFWCDDCLASPFYTACLSSRLEDECGFLARLEGYVRAKMQQPNFAYLDYLDADYDSAREKGSEALFLDGIKQNGLKNFSKVARAMGLSRKSLQTGEGEDPAASVLGLEQKDVSDNSKLKSKHRQRSFLQVDINGKVFDTLPDTMSAENIMHESVATALGIPIEVDETKQRTFTEACGKQFHSVGEAVVSVSFPGEDLKALPCRFFVVKSCTVPMIMGDSFLRATETLTRFRHRLQKRFTSSMKKFWRICYTGVPRRRLSCSLDSYSVQANADTGSDVDLVSLEYARRRGWKVKKLERGKGFVQLANKTIVKVSGYVKARLSIGGYSNRKIFYVLDGLVCSVLLGDTTLEELDVFNKYESAFVDIVSNPEADDCHNISWVERLKQQRTDEILSGDVPPPILSSNSILPQEERPQQQTIPRSSKRSRFKQFISKKRSYKTPEEDREAWDSAFMRALESLSDVEVKARDQAEREMAILSGTELQDAQDANKTRQQQYAEQTRAIKLARDRFFGIPAHP